MGIRNNLDEAMNHYDVRLITPHGDSERMSIGVCLAACSPHNPSWGFGTLERIEIDSGIWDS